MNRVSRTMMATLVACAALLGSLPAMAQGKASAEAESTEDGYGYKFSDDPLTAGGFGPTDATIKVRPQGVRRTLIRPRTSFVSEMLKSVENI